MAALPTHGPPVALTPDVRKALLRAARNGETDQTCCAFAGIGVRTLSDWKKATADGTAHPEAAAIVAELKAAQGEVRQAMQERIQLASWDDWKAAAWWLERKFPDEFARRQVLHVHGQETVEEQAARIRGIIVGMDYQTRKRGRLAVLNGDLEQAENGNGHPGRDM